MCGHSPPLLELLAGEDEGLLVRGGHSHTCTLFSSGCLPVKMSRCWLGENIWWGTSCEDKVGQEHTAGHIKLLTSEDKALLVRQEHTPGHLFKPLAGMIRCCLSEENIWQGMSSNGLLAQ